MDKESNKCSKCGTENFHTDYMAGETKSKMDEVGCCFSCAFWFNKIGIKKFLIIEGHSYVSHGMKDTSKWLGMGGRLFRIQKADGEIIETNDLWSQGKIPEIFLPDFPNNAVFMDGAGAHKQTDGGTFWTESYPTKAE